ncbi:MAG: PhoH family protein [Clostridiales bacterium]|nr:PhoH family protein [Clostridiales bacterium]
MLLSLENAELYASLFGLNDRNLAVMEQELAVGLSLHGQELRIAGAPENVALTEETVRRLLALLRRGETLDPARIRYMIALLRSGDADRAEEMMEDVVAVTHRGRKIRCKTLGQRAYISSIRKNELTLAVGPAGTGKTYLAMAMAVMALKNRETERIILTRPAVEAGEKLGFLPGDMTQKVDPYLRPLYDALYDMMGTDSYQRLVERGVLEIAPLAFMRGRTLSDAFIILDEAQNTTPEQMKMFLTRLGENARCVVTGDRTQIDLPRGRASGLEEAMTVLRGIPGIGIIELTSDDVVRHELVQKIVRAYDRYALTRSAEEEHSK